MRAVAVVVLVVSMIFVLRWQPAADAAIAEPAPAGEARAPAALAAEPRAFVRTAVPASSPAGDASPAAPSPSPAGPIDLLLCESGTFAPIPATAVCLWVYGERNTSHDLRTDAQGLMRVAPELLAHARGCNFAVTLPEFRDAISLRPVAAVAELRRSAPFRLVVPRGRWRGLQVVDERGAGVAGVRLAGSPMHPVTTDAGGHARLCLPTPPPLHVEVSAPGYRVTAIEVPPDDQAWIVRLRRANRLEIELVGAADVRGYHVDVTLAATFKQRQFYQSKYEFTAGRAADGTPARWRELERNASLWECGFNDRGFAVLDHLDEGGTADLALWRFDELLERRRIECPAAGATTRVRFVVPSGHGQVALVVLDARGTRLPGAVVRMAPRPRATIAPDLDEGFPVWSPRAVTARDGTCALPRPDQRDALVVCAAEDHAVRVTTFDELASGGFAIRLLPGRAVDVEVRGRDGAVLSEGVTTGYSAHARPHARLAHGLWLDPASGDAPLFHFRGLAPGVAEFRVTYLPDEVLYHDTSVPTVRMVVAASVDEMQLGK